MEKLLLVDDNDNYARLLHEYFEPLGFSIDRAWNAKEGFDMFSAHPSDYYQVIVTDITMESQLAGLSMLKKIKKKGFGGTVVVASTGFDQPMGMPASRLFLGLYGVHYLIPKTTVKNKQIKFYTLKFFAAPISKFEKIGQET